MVSNMVLNMVSNKWYKKGLKKGKPINALDKSLLGGIFNVPNAKVFTPNTEKPKSQSWPTYIGSKWTIVGKEYWTK
jgi:hypothetical protein